MSIPSVEGDSFIARRQAAYAALFTPSQLDQLMTVYSDDVVYSDYSWGAIGMDKETHRSFLKVYSPLSSQKGAFVNQYLLN